MSYLIIALLLVILGGIEFFIIRKGMKAGRKSSQYLQNSSSPSSHFSKTVQHHLEPQEPLPKKEEKAAGISPKTPKKNVLNFPGNAEKMEGLPDEKPEPGEKTPDEESSALDMIQEIRGAATGPSDRKPQASLLKQEPPSQIDIKKEVMESPFREEETEQDVMPLEENEEIEEEVIIVEEVDAEDAEEEAIAAEDQIKNGLELVRQGRLDEGIELIEGAIQQVPDKADAHFNLGIAYTLKDALPKAIRAYQRAIRIDPKYGKAFYNLGTLYLKQGNIKEAIPKLEHAVKLLSDPMKALWNLYEAYRSNGFFTKALTNLQRLIELESEDASLYNHLGICYVKLGDYAKAINAWKRSISLGASSPLIHYNLGKTYELSGTFRQATEHYHLFLEHASQNAEWQELVTEVRERLDNLQMQ